MYRVVINFQGHDFSSRKIYPLNEAQSLVEHFFDCVDPQWQSYYFLTIEMLEFGRWVTYSIHQWEE